MSALDDLDGIGERVAVEVTRDAVINAECALLACVLCDEDGRHRALDRAAARVSEGDFADPKRAAVWRAICRLRCAPRVRCSRTYGGASGAQRCDTYSALEQRTTGRMSLEGTISG